MTNYFGHTATTLSHDTESTEVIIFIHGTCPMYVEWLILVASSVCNKASVNQMPVANVTYIFSSPNTSKLQINDIYGSVTKHLDNLTVHVSNILGSPEMF